MRRIRHAKIGCAITAGLLGIVACGGTDASFECGTPPVPENVAAAPSDATVTPSGLAWIVLREGAAGGVSPTLADEVTVHYSGWTTDGEMFDSSVERCQSNTFRLGGLIEGWQEGIQLMSEGDRFRFWIPGALAYDNSPREGAPRGTLVFDVELIDVVR